MENWRKDARSEAIIVDLEALVPQDHLLRKIEKVMDYEWLYDFEHMACGVVADWGEIGHTEIRICALNELEKCDIFHEKHAQNCTTQRCHRENFPDREKMP